MIDIFRTFDFSLFSFPFCFVSRGGRFCRAPRGNTAGGILLLSSREPAHRIVSYRIVSLSYRVVSYRYCYRIASHRVVIV